MDHAVTRGKKPQTRHYNHCFTPLALTRLPGPPVLPYFGRAPWAQTRFPGEAPGHVSQPWGRTRGSGVCRARGKSGARGHVGSRLHTQLREHTTTQREATPWLVAFPKHKGFGRGDHRATCCCCSLPGVAPAPGTPPSQQQAGSGGKVRVGRMESWLQDPAELPKQTASSLGALAFPLPPGHTKSVSAPCGSKAEIASETPGRVAHTD